MQNDFKILYVNHVKMQEAFSFLFTATPQWHTRIIPA